MSRARQVHTAADSLVSALKGMTGSAQEGGKMAQKSVREKDATDRTDAQRGRIV